MKRILLLALLLAPLTALAQFTTVSGTVTDPTGLPYSNGTISAGLVVPSGAGAPTLNGFSYPPPSQPTGLNAAGSFTLNLADNAVLLPAATKWTFLVCSAAGTVNPALGKGPVCFNAGPITITGASQSITATLNAAAVALSNFAGGTGTVSSVTCTVPLVCTPSPITTTGTVSAPTAVTSAASLTNNSVMTGAGGQASQTATGVTNPAAGELDVGTNGGAGGVVGWNGATSGKATCTAPAVAGTNTNPLICSNAISLPSNSGIPAVVSAASANTGVILNGNPHPDSTPEA